MACTLPGFLSLTLVKVKSGQVIVVSGPQGQHDILAIVPISSKPQSETIDAALEDWQGAGLIKPSVARVHRLTTMLQADLMSELGGLSADDTNKVQNSIRRFLNL